MGRLIDTSAFDEITIKDKSEEFVNGAKYILDLIDAQPTAYDVENVVAELVCNSRFVDDINKHNIKCISCVVGQKTAIDIVKRGGVE